MYFSPKRKRSFFSSINFWIYSWVDFYKHSAYGFDGNDTVVDNSYPLFNYQPNYSVNFYTETKSPNNGIDFDENIYGLLIKGNSLEIKIGNYSPRFGPLLSGNLGLSGQYPAFSNIHIKFYTENISYNLLYGDLESSIICDLMNECLPSNLISLLHRTSGFGVRPLLYSVKKFLNTFSQ